MSSYEQASHVYWRCQYHIVWTPKYRFRILTNKLGKDVYRSIYVYCQQLGCIVLELNVQIDHVHLVVKVPPKLSISKLMGALKGKIALKFYHLIHWGSLSNTRQQLEPKLPLSQKDQYGDWNCHQIPPAGIPSHQKASLPKIKEFFSNKVFVIP